MEQIFLLGDISYTQISLTVGEKECSRRKKKERNKNKINLWSFSYTIHIAKSLEMLKNKIFFPIFSIRRGKVTSVGEEKLLPEKNDNRKIRDFFSLRRAHQNTRAECDLVSEMMSISIVNVG